MTGPPKTKIERDGPSRLIRADEVIRALGRRAGDRALYLVGGTVRDALLGTAPADIDIAVDAPVADFARELDSDAVLHENFDTAEVTLLGRRVDLARTRSEKYARAGSLPEVTPDRIEKDLARRDFTINSLAVPLADPDELIDPYGGLEDIERRVIRVLHPGSFTDDPTRALRAARYAAKLGFDIDHRTADLLTGVDLGTVSPQRVRSELRLIAEEPTAMEALRLISAWGLLTIAEADVELIADAFDLVEHPPWTGCCSRAEIFEAAVFPAAIEKSRPLLEYPGSPSRASKLAAGRDPVALLLARAAGAMWLDRWISEWRDFTLEITGDDLLDAGVPRGEGVGAGLAAALDAALDEGVLDRAAQLEIAVNAAHSASRHPDPRESGN